MKDFKNWGVKIRESKENNYKAIWYNLKTIRIGKDKATELAPEFSEFYDVSLGNKCEPGKCNFCYVSSNSDGKFYENICETWKKREFMLRILREVAAFCTLNLLRTLTLPRKLPIT